MTDRKGMKDRMKESMTKIKICGLTKPEEAGYLNEYGVDYAGFVFYEKSKRNISFDRAGEIMRGLDKGIKRVAVTVSPDASLIERIGEHGFDIIQIHGDMSEEAVKAAGIPVWMALNPAEEDNEYEKRKFYEELIKKSGGKIEGVLMDAPQFGSGKPFNWHKSRRLLKAGDRSSPFEGLKIILAGGLDSHNVTEGIRIFEPYAVDVSSKVEDENGKSRDKIRDFVSAVKSAKEIRHE